jgi:hypothetical protein
MLYPREKTTWYSFAEGPERVTPSVTLPVKWVLMDVIEVVPEVDATVLEKAIVSGTKAWEPLVILVSVCDVARDTYSWSEGE